MDLIAAAPPPQSQI
uniref:Uncharacterized protein n=1 Tax=Anguilla anguilla TaxID=7936 RepID=A0A0E9SJB4_ANGAN